jgi:HK97 family phage major capsid protein
MDLTELKTRLDGQAVAWEDFVRRNDARFKALETDFGKIEGTLLKQNRLGLGLGGGGGGSMNESERKALDSAVRALLAGDQAKANEFFVEAKAMSVGTGPDGGYVVATQFSTELMKIMAEISPMSRLARTIELERGISFEEVIDKEQAQATWVGETQSRDDTTTPGLGAFQVVCHELQAMPKATQTLIDSASIDVLGWLQGKVAEAFGTTESAAFHSGDGVSKPRGFLTYTTAATADSARTWGQLQHIATGTSGAFPAASTSVNSADVLIDVVSALKPQYRAGATWLMNRATAGAVRKLKDADGRHVWVDSLILGQPSVLLGYPVEISEDMPDIGAGSLSIAFGNFQKGYTIVRRLGTRFLVDPYTAKPYVRLYAYTRVGGGVSNFEAVKFLKFS